MLSKKTISIFSLISSNHFYGGIPILFCPALAWSDILLSSISGLQYFLTSRYWFFLLLFWVLKWSRLLSPSFIHSISCCVALSLFSHLMERVLISIPYARTRTIQVLNFFLG